MTYKGTHENLYKLTPQERRVLFLIGAGLHNQSIAERLNVGTVDTHINNIYSKIEIPPGMSGRAWLAVNHRRLLE